MTDTIAAPTVPHLPSDILSSLCEVLLEIPSSASTLLKLARTSVDLRDAAIPRLYRRVTLTSDNLIPFLTTSPAGHVGCGLSTPSPWAYTTHLRIASLPDDLCGCHFPPALPSSSLLPNLRNITLDSGAVWQLIVYTHAHHTPHPLITFLRARATPTHLTIHYPNTERTAHSFGGGYCCCFAAVRAFQQNPLRAAAFDRSSTARLISAMAAGWALKCLTLEGATDDEIPRDVKAKRMEVGWAACQCADEKFHGEWCFNHVSPMKRVEQVRGLLKWGGEKEMQITVRGVENVGGGSEEEDVGRWIHQKLAEGTREDEACCGVDGHAGQGHDIAAL
ncbi:uncharacterized protein MKK02DRAFT_42205 [Dioszegia hungarica]|uniref:F-box domain-containing protein n=1 Tax=Dioszegia hungarica TaxID=4972 RepID=A0AA38HAP2_9TREE|nr:uncharacterized protein MKK02DRAFT_42205 [Dioszegia hungarica]KAI9637832.1 hypothetical protein MKK02DRAFT_42205 [Dioszegia hungarica]